MGGSDADRPLTGSVRAEAAAVGSALPEIAPPPELVLVSPARRATETFEVLGLAVEAWRERDLYLAPPRALIERIHQVDADVSTLLVVGHNPGLHQVVLDLVGVSIADVPRFPAASLAVLDVDSARWEDVRPGTARLVRIHAP